MAKKKAQPVVMKKEERMGFTITAETLRKADNAARRKVRIEQGTFVRGGRHGGSDEMNNRRERKRAKQQCRGGEYD
ncbi:MAG: hypothetical protein K2W95_20490 [Candidatus Obscuribacterales bacterium]|nr:hypothetical protein [Candidatus Obscuribacterales bacterium]